MAEIHVVVWSFETEVVLYPLQVYHPDRVYLIQLEIEQGNYRETATNHASEVASQLRRKVETRVVRCKLELMAIHDALRSIVDQERGNRVLINLSSGPRLVAAAAGILAATSPVEMYYVQRQSYYIQREFSSGVERVLHLPAIPRTIEEIPIDSKLCFVLMPFATHLQPIYEDIVVPVVESQGLRCRRADDVFDNRPIMDDIWDSIRKARVVLSDLTGRNPNVFYEAGIAHALGKEVILLSQSLDDVPFDLRHLRCILYSDSMRGARKLEDGLAETLRTVLARTKLPEGEAKAAPGA